jgi:hypothetical protein
MLLLTSTMGALEIWALSVCPAFRSAFGMQNPGVPFRISLIHLAFATFPLLPPGPKSPWTTVQEIVGFPLLELMTSLEEEAGLSCE